MDNDGQKSAMTSAVLIILMLKLDWLEGCSIETLQYDVCVGALLKYLSSHPLPVIL